MWEGPIGREGRAAVEAAISQRKVIDPTLISLRYMAGHEEALPFISVAERGRRRTVRPKPAARRRQPRLQHRACPPARGGRLRHEKIRHRLLETRSDQTVR